MKKLMIAFAAVALAFAANAAAYSWSTGMGGNVYLPGTTSTATGTAYLFNAVVLSQTDIVNEFAAGTLNLGTASSLSNATITNGKISTTSFTWGEEGDLLNAYFAAIINIDGNDTLYVSTLMENQAALADGKVTGIKFAEKSASQAAGFSAAEGFNGAGWYTASVPEPTSALMLLLGMAGLALRRKQA